MSTLFLLIKLHSDSLVFSSDGEVIDEPVRRRETRKKEFRHAYSEMLPDVEVDDKRRSQAMIEVKAHAFNRLQEELQKAQKVITTRKKWKTCHCQG